MEPSTEARLPEETIRNPKSRILSCSSFWFVFSQTGLKNSYCLPKISFQKRLTEFPIRQGYRLIADTVVGEPDCLFEMNDKAKPQGRGFVQGEGDPCGPWGR